MLCLLSIILMTKLTYGQLIHLGNKGGLSYDVRRVNELDPESSKEYPLNNISLVFTTSRHGHRVLRVETPIWWSSGEPRQFQIKNLMGKPIKQVFIAVHYGQTVSKMLDFDGKKVRQIYSEEGGRTYAEPKWDRHHRLYIAESGLAGWRDIKGVTYRKIFSNRIYFTKSWKPIPREEHYTYNKL